MRKRTFTRKNFLKSTGLLTAGFAASALPGRETEASDSPTSDRILIRGAVIIPIDPEQEGYLTSDILIENNRISEIAPDIEDSEAEIIEADGKILMPGFVDTHRYLWQGVLRNVLPNGELSDYMRVVTGEARRVFTPEYAYIGNLISALSAIDSGVTTILDWSHIGNSPAHSDAAIRGLRESGIRGDYAMGGGSDGDENRFPDDIRRIRDEQIPEDDPMLSLALAAGINKDQ